MLSFCISLFRLKYPETHKTYPKTINKASWYKSISNFFSNYIFKENIIYNRRCILLLFDWPGILCFTFSSLFNFFLSVFFLSSMFSALLPITKRTIILNKILLKYDDNTRLLERSVIWEKNIDSLIRKSLCIIF